MGTVNYGIRETWVQIPHGNPVALWVSFVKQRLRIAHLPGRKGGSRQKTESQLGSLSQAVAFPDHTQSPPGTC